MPMMSTNVGGGNRNALRVPVLADGLRTWSYGLLDCLTDLPMRMCGILSSPPTQHHQSSILTHLTT